MQEGFVVVTDRGGHLNNARMLLSQMGVGPEAYVMTWGPEVAPLRREAKVLVIPYLFSWLGKHRFLNPVKALWHVGVALIYALRLRPKVVVSLGATDVVFFCYWAKLFGARVIHVECMNQVYSPSVTGRLLYPICNGFYVQWEDLLPCYGPKAKYAGWVL
jgi:beta-1,4-N-acetylglucosaminyltransferase